MKYLAVPLVVGAIGAGAVLIIWALSRYGRLDDHSRRRANWGALVVLSIAAGGFLFLLFHYGFPVY